MFVERMSHMPVKIISEGKVECVVEPRCSNELEGYSAGEEYKFQRCACQARSSEYYRVFPDGESSYYETCGPSVFTQYFKIVMMCNSETTQGSSGDRRK